MHQNAALIQRAILPTTLRLPAEKHTISLA
jgi:hypothetical protein